MRLFFEDPHGGRIAIDTETQTYCSNFENGRDYIPGKHRYIKVKSVLDLNNILHELDFNAWGYDDSIHDNTELYPDAEIVHLNKKGYNEIVFLET